MAAVNQITKLMLKYTNEPLWTYSLLNLDVDTPQKCKTKPGASSVNREQEAGATVCTCSTELDIRRLENCFLV